jgi:hypothetical protein
LFSSLGVSSALTLFLFFCLGLPFFRFIAPGSLLLLL